jgi:transcriptional regulator with XRE-family HTH domain
MLAMPFERRSSAGRDLMERSSMGHPRWQTNLRQLRQRAGLTPGQLAERLGVTHHAIQALEKGHRAVPKGFDFKLAEALGCSVAELYRTERIARSRRWMRAWVNLTDAPKSPATRPWDSEE